MSQTIQQTALENFITYCKTVDISPEELQNPNVLFQTAQSKALTSEMDKDKKFAEEALVTIAKEFKTMPPYRACVSSFLIGLYGERGVSSLYADRDLLDFFDITIKFVVTFINRMHKLSGKSQLTPEAIRSFFKQLDMKKMIDLDPSLFEVMQGLPQICTAVLSRISTSRAMRSYLRGNQTLPACALVGCVLEPAHYIAAMLSITEQQQVLVLFPNSKIGFEVTVEEVDSNFEIFSLLQIALAKEGYMDKLGLPNYKYNEEIDRLLRRDMSKGAQNAVVDEAAFNYYTLHPINKGNRGHYRLDADYLCEGQEQINAFGTLDGRLILLADKCTVKRSWANAAALGMHPNLHPTLTINRVLPKEEYEKWVDMVESIGTYQQDKADE